MENEISEILKLVTKDYIYWIQYIISIISLLITLYTMSQVIIIKNGIIKKKQINHLLDRLRELKSIITEGKRPSDLLQRARCVFVEMPKHISRKKNRRLSLLIHELPKSIENDTDIEKLDIAIDSILTEFGSTEV